MDFADVVVHVVTQAKAEADAAGIVTDTGSGLGLSIVRSVTRAHAGHIHAVPWDGGGLVVTVTMKADNSPGGVLIRGPLGQS